MRRLAPLLALGIAAPAFAHAGHAAHAEAPGWEFEPLVVVPLLVTAILFAFGWLRLWQRSGLGRHELARSGWLFAAGWLVLAGAVASPLHEAGERSFTMHMIEHELIMLIASLLLVLSRPAAILLWAFPQPARRTLGSVGQVGWLRSLWRLLTDPFAATVVQGAAMWAWHMPALFDRALEHDSWHIAQHLCFLVSALLFWWAMANTRHGYGVSSLCLFLTSLIGGALGALMAFSTSPWYADYAAMGMTPWGLSPAEDQQLAGLLMWIPGGLVHAGAALWFLYKWMNGGEARHAVAAQ